MALDVHLSRSGNEVWGFRFIGGADYKIPLTVVKVVPNSPAERAGLQNGDTVSSISGTDATKMTHDDAKNAVCEAKAVLKLEVIRGLYDPVLDDQESILEYEPDDFDQSSQPTEVQFEIQNFDVPKLTESRSLTASPFVIPTKPYRPFSADPLPIPPLEDPIILNPNYRDDFGKYGFSEDSLPFSETRFKLPISEQYDPDGTRKKRKIQEEYTFSKEFKEEKMTKEEIKFMEQMKQEIDLEKIELTATSIVDESIQRALNVTQEIKKEIDFEMRESSLSISEVKQSTNETKNVEELVKSSKVNELVELIDKTTEETVNQNGYEIEANVEKEVKKFERIDKKGHDVEERKMSTQKEIEETIVAASVKRKSTSTDLKQETEIKVLDAKEDIPRKASVDNSKQKEVKLLQSEKKETREIKDERKCQQKAQNIQKSGNTETVSDSKLSTSKLLAEQRAYTIGLQTIPNIRGSIHSSYHYNLLLKTFFVHLTDVMVALSGFILSEPVFKPVDESKEIQERINREEKIVEGSVKISKAKISEDNVSVKKKEEKKQAVDITQSEIIDKHDIEVEQILERAELKGDINIRDSTDTLSVETEEEVRKRKLSGARMAQLVERKSVELTQKMDAVISEFQTKTGNEELTVQRDRRSRSRSKVEEEVMQESDPLEWLSKTESSIKSQGVTEVTNTTDISERFMESVNEETKKIESRYETKEVKVPKPKEGKNTYIAIVEAHVYTNKDAILEEHLADISETASTQCAEETNIALQASEAVLTEKVAIETSQSKQEVADVTVEEYCKFSSVSATKSKEIERVEEKEIAQEKKENTEKTSYDKKETEIEKKEVIVQESLEPVVEIQEIEKTEVAAIEESIEVSVESAKEGIIIEEAEAKEEPIVVEATVVVHPKKIEKPIQEEFAELSIVKKVEIEDDSEVQVEEIEVSELEKRNYESIQSYAQDHSADQSIQAQSYQAYASHTEETSIEQSFQSQAIVQQQPEAIIQKRCGAIQEESKAIQESSLTAKSTEIDATKKLTLQTNLCQEQLQTQTSVQSDDNDNIDTPTPSTVPPTPLTDEYVFRLAIPLPKSRSTTPVPRDPTPERDHDEDPHIVKKKLVPHIETTIESVVYDPPLPTPPAEEKVQSPVYTKPGSMGGADKEEFTKEEIKEIERKSSLLASAIDETIKNIEEYKEEVGIETKKEVEIEKINKTEVSSRKEANIVIGNEVSEETKAIIDNGAVKAIENKIIDTNESHDNQIQKEWAIVDKQIKTNYENVNDLAKNFNASSESNEVNKNMIITKETKEILNVSNETENVPQNFDTIREVVTGKQETEIKNSLRSETANTIAKTEIEEDTQTSLKSNEEVIRNSEASVILEMDIIRKKELEESWERNKEILQEVKPVQFNPQKNTPMQNEESGFRSINLEVPDSQEKSMSQRSTPVYVTDTGEVLGTIQGFVNGLEDAVVDEEVAKELGKPGISEEKIAELISGEAEMLREAHVMGLSRVLTSHMHRATDDDDSSVDFKKIKPIVESLKDSEVLKALNDDLAKTKEEKKKEERRWTTFLQKPKKPVPKAKYGYHGYIESEQVVEEPYRVKIVKQPKPKVAPDYKPEDFDTGPLPWEERALNDTPPPPVAPEEPILVPEEGPEFLEAVDPLPESEVPDLEDTGITLPPPPPEQPIAEEPTTTEEQQEVVENTEEDKEGEKESDLEAKGEETNVVVEEMEQNQLAEQLMRNVQSVVDPNATLEQQLAQMRVQLAALAQLPGVIQQTLELVTKQLSQLTHLETKQSQISQEMKIQQTISESYEEQVTQNHIQQEESVNTKTENQEELLKIEEMNGEEITEDKMIEEQKKIEKQKKELVEQTRLEQESRQVRQRSTPRPGKPKPVFGPLNPEDRPVILPGGRRWRNPKDVYDEQLIAEILNSQAEIIKGKAKGINFMKYEKPPVSLEHLKDSEVYKLIHDLEQTPVRRVELLTPVIAESDYREKCRSLSPSGDRMSKEHPNIPQQVQL